MSESQNVSDRKPLPSVKEFLEVLEEGPATRRVLMEKLGRSQQAVSTLVCRAGAANVYISGWETPRRQGKPSPIYSRKTSPDQKDVPYNREIALGCFEQAGPMAPADVFRQLTTVWSSRSD